MSLDAIVVLGCPVAPDGRPTRTLARRAALGVSLFERGRAPRVVFSGGVTRAGLSSEAAAAAEVARGLGLPESASILEDRSRSTEENARFVAELLGPGARIVLATDGFHVMRARWIFMAYFAHVEGEGTVGSWSTRLRGGLREVPLVPFYALKLALTRRAPR